MIDYSIFTIRHKSTLKAVVEMNMFRCLKSQRKNKIRHMSVTTYWIKFFNRKRLNIKCERKPSQRRLNIIKITFKIVFPIYNNIKVTRRIPLRNQESEGR